MLRVKAKTLDATSTSQGDLIVLQHGAWVAPLSAQQQLCVAFAVKESS